MYRRALLSSQVACSLPEIAVLARYNEVVLLMAFDLDPWDNMVHMQFHAIGSVPVAISASKVVSHFDCELKANRDGSPILGFLPNWLPGFREPDYFFSQSVEV